MVTSLISEILKDEENHKSTSYPLSINDVTSREECIKFALILLYLHKYYYSGHEDRLQHHLAVQGSFFSNVTQFSLSKLNSVWSKSQSSLPKSIYNFTIRYINNSLPTRKNLSRWGITSNSDCSFCLNTKTLIHIVAGCQSYLPRFTWRHDSVLDFIAQALRPTINSKIFADLPGYNSPSIITGDAFCPDLLLSIFSDCLYILELTVGYESNRQKNVDRKQAKYKDLIAEKVNTLSL